jgi:exodeoxyribonuclease V alpha subunit
MSSPDARLAGEVRNRTRRRPPTDAPAQPESLAGLVERVTFHNPDNGFCVLRVKARGQRDLITIVGHAPVVSAGEFIEASGSDQPSD